MKNPPMKYMIRRNQKSFGFSFRKNPPCSIYKTRTITFCYDDEVSEILNLPLKQYRKFLVEQFNAQLATIDGFKDGEMVKQDGKMVKQRGKIIKQPVVYFKTMSDAEKAMEWIDSITTLVNEVLIGNW